MFVGIIALLFFVGGLHAQNPETPKFTDPTGPAVEADLFIANNEPYIAVLTSSISSGSTALPINNADQFVDFPTVVQVEDERILVDGKTGSSLDVASGGRGFNCETSHCVPAAHGAGIQVRLFYPAVYHNQPVAELIALGNEVPLCSVEAELTIDTGGSVTIPRSGCFTVDTFADAAADDLSALVCTAGQQFILMAENLARVVTIKDGSVFLMAADFVLDSNDKVANFLCRSTNVGTQMNAGGSGSTPASSGITCDGSPTELTIDVGGEITITGSECFTVDTFADAASDDLDIINCTAGQRFKLTPADTTRTVVLKDDDLNIDIQADFSLNHLHDLFGGYCFATNVVIEEDRSNAGT